MSAARQSRESEKILQEINSLLPGLFITAWYPFPQQAAHLASVIQDKLNLFRTTILDELERGEIEKNE